MQVGLFFYLSGGGLFASALCYNFGMTTNAFAISRHLVEKGVDKPTADAVAEEIVTHSDESHASKSDIIRVETKINIVIGLLVGVFIAIFVWANG